MERDRDKLKSKSNWFEKFTIASFVIAFFPLLVLAICSPILAYYGCEGGLNFHCNVSSLEEFAENITAFGTWGNFFTVPIVFIVWLLVFILGHLPEENERKKKRNEKIH